MSVLLESFREHPRRWILLASGIGASIAVYSIVSRRVRRPASLPVSVRKESFKTIEGCDGLTSALASLERLLHELESTRFSSLRDRDRYDLIYSVLARLRGILADLQKFERNEFEPRPATEEIAKAVWNNNPSSPNPGTLSVLSDDSFLSAVDDFQWQAQDSVSVSVDQESATLYREGLEYAEKNLVMYRKSRADVCACESEIDFAAKLWCLRRAFDAILADQSSRRWLIQAGRNLMADLLRQDKKDPKDFYVAFDRLMDYMEDPTNYEQIETELRTRKVEHVNIWDVLIDFVLLDSFDDLRKPPSGIMALFKNPFMSRYVKESTLNNIIWSLIKVKRSRLQIQDGFVSHFYDISQIVSVSLTMGLLGGSDKQFEELCLEFKNNIMGLLSDLFNPAKDALHDAARAHRRTSASNWSSGWRSCRSSSGTNSSSS
ncbi:hypothetical protein M3Y99_01550800 [Aphelenchoides fujianensis]|nr:hypothetical protein M3Y99_01550800 [Aphelenchoides fujianensis]